MTNKCPKCQGTMEKGAILDHSHGAVFTSAWVPDREIPKTTLDQIQHLSWFARMFRTKKVSVINAYRCKKCGFIECYAAHM